MPVRHPAAAAFALLVGALLLSPSVASADQFVLFDVTFTYTWDDAVNASPSQSHYYVNDGNVLNTERPSNWLSPVDYRNGTVHIRVEVIDKPPGDQTGYWSLCYVANEGSYGCTNTGEYTAEGLYEKDVDMTSWWQNDQLDWAFGVKQMDLVYKKSSAGSDHVHQFPEVKDLLTPTTLRITMVQVSTGDSYDESSLGLDFGSGGSGGSGGAAGGPSAMPEGGSAGAAGNPAAQGGSAGATGSVTTPGGSNAGVSGAGAGGGAPATGGSPAASPDMPAAGSDALPPSSVAQQSSCSFAAPRPTPGREQPLLALGLLASTLLRRRQRRRYKQNV